MLWISQTKFFQTHQILYFGNIKRWAKNDAVNVFMCITKTLGTKSAVFADYSIFIQLTALYKESCLCLSKPQTRGTVLTAEVDSAIVNTFKTFYVLLRVDNSFRICEMLWACSSCNRWIALKLFIDMMIVLLLGVSNWWSLFPDYN